MDRSHYKKLQRDDKFDRYYTCWANNHCGYAKFKRFERRRARTLYKREIPEEIRQARSEMFFSFVTALPKYEPEPDWLDANVENVYVNSIPLNGHYVENLISKVDF